MTPFYYSGRRFYYAPLIIAAIAVIGAVTMALWNTLMPALFGIKAITYWQALGLLILGRFFFGSFRLYSRWQPDPWRYKLHEKVSKMTPEERREFFRKMHSYRQNWYREHCGEKVTGEENPQKE